MTPGNRRRTTSSRGVTTLTAGELSAALGPAEAQYAEELALAPQTVGLACDGTLVNESAADESAGANFMAWTMAWNDLANETGYRLQVDFDSATFVSEDTPYFHFADTTARTILVNTPGSDIDVSMRVMAHVGHDPGSHGDTPIAGDVLSNTCTIRLETSPP